MGEGNCKGAGAGFGKNEMYPCFDQSVTYGMATTGLNVTGMGALRTSLAVEQLQLRDKELNYYLNTMSSVSTQVQRATPVAGHTLSI